MKNVLVTGATGFIGKQFVRFLLEKNHLVRVLLRDEKKSVLFDPCVDINVGDLTDPLTLKNACVGIDTVFHLAGYAHAFEENHASFAEEHHRVNFEGTENILQKAIEAKVKRFIFFSSVKAVADHPRCIDENFTLLPASSYGIAKRKAEELVLSAKKTGMHVCILRPSLVYGPDWKGNLAAMLKAIDRGFFPPLPPIKNARSMISIDDICEAAWLAALSPKADGEIYFVTDNVPYSTDELYKTMREALGKSIPSFHIPLTGFKLLALCGDLGKKILKRRMPFDSESMKKLFGNAHYSSGKIHRDLGFIPRYDFKKMLPDIIKKYHSS
ncbi:MAG: NAD-dependent epimerase/dehydratase [uncultured bacterium]|nr:MAG: NAD-dependent epimerase/dehydratase [uncultured bacterium]